MPKQSTSHAGSSAGKGRPVKVIQKTADLLQRSAAKGKSKENAVFGDLNKLIGGS